MAGIQVRYLKSDTFIDNVICKVKEQELRRIADILQHEYSVKEEGCIQYESYIDGAAFVTFERRSNQASLDKHLAQDHVKKYVPLMRECVENGTFDVLFINGGEIEAVTI